MPPEGADRLKYRIAKFGSLERSQQMDARITEVAAGVGVEFHLDKLTRTPNTLKAHRLIRLAGQKGVQDGVVESLFDGYFCNGADLGDDKVLADLGHRGGLDYDSALAMLQSDDGAREVARRRPDGAQLRHPGRAELRAAGPCAVLRRGTGRGDGRSFRRAWELLKNKAASSAATGPYRPTSPKGRGTACMPMASGSEASSPKIYDGHSPFVKHPS